MHETFEHTADLGVRVRADDLDDLLVEAGRALAEILVANPEAGGTDRVETVTVEADDPADLLLDWLSELLYLFSVRRFVPRTYAIGRSNGAIEARLCGWTFDPERDEGGHEVKAVTYHGLAVERRDGGWTAEVILDI